MSDPHRPENHAEETADEFPVSPTDPKPTVVGLGASAGGLAALKQFFATVPKDSGLIFVVVVHLSPEHKSHLAELLQPHVKMTVRQVTESVHLKPNNVYVIPPNANLNAIDTHLRLSKLEERSRHRAPIDHFLGTLARTHDGHAVGVILTGTGSDGALGLREITEKGGLAIVQDPAEAEYNGMPQSAIATGLVDAVLPIAEMTEFIRRYAATLPEVRVPADGEEPPPDQRRMIQRVFTQLRARTGRDFSRYKSSTTLRRITRRMQLARIETLDGYVQWLHEHPDEVGDLADDLLITVTRFFRDADVFDALKKRVVPKLLSGKSADDTVRVWTVGCATGEEAYSVAILLLEELAGHDNPPRIQIFASDLHEHSLERARDGFFPGDITADVSAERLKRFFVEEQGGYRIRKDVREMIVFAPHNLLSDPPFSRLDLITCRNLLIYLERDIHKEVIELFHYALNPEGFLALGTAESVEGSDLLRTVDKKCCIFQKRNVPAREPTLPVFPSRRMQLLDRVTPGARNLETIAYGALHQRLVETFSSPSLLVSSDDKVVHLSPRAGRYLVHPGGEMTASVFRLVREELRIELRSAVHTARDSKARVRSRRLPVAFEGLEGGVILDVRPAPQHDGFVLVTFDESQPDEKLTEPPHQETRSETDDARSQDLKAELELSRQRLQAIIAEYDTTQEEMKASNEELQSANEELRSTMEELETSKEELQSMNEELQAVNQENRHKVEELAQLSSDLQNLLTSTDIATLFLDRELRILRFTPRVGELFNVRLTDRGRPLSDLTHRLGYTDLMEDAKRVLNRLTPVESEIGDEEGRWYLTRVLPYRSSDDRIDGVVITFVEITERRRAEEALRDSEERYRVLVDSAREYAILMVDAGGAISSWNPGAEHIFGLREEEAIGRNISMLFTDEDRAAGVPEQEMATSQREGRSADERWQRRADGSRFWASGVLEVMRTNDGALRGFVKVLRDNTERKQSEEQLQRLNATLEQRVEERTRQVREQEERFRKLVEASAQMVWTTDAHGMVVDDSPSWRAYTGQNGEQRKGSGWIDAVHPDDRSRALESWLRAVQTAEPVDAQFRVYQARSLRYRWTAIRAVPLLDDAGAVHGWIGMNLDIDDLKRAEADVRDMASRLAMAEQGERRRLAQVLHDDLQQRLFALQLHIDMITQCAKEGEIRSVEQTARKVHGWLDEAIATTRRLTVDLSPPILNQGALIEALNWLATQMRELHGIRIEVASKNEVVVPDEDMRVLLFQGIRELLFNVVKHAGAECAVVEVARRGSDLRIVVRDEGVGFDPVRNAPEATGSFGLSNLRERLALFGCELKIDSGRGEGTRATIHVPARHVSPQHAGS